MKALSSLPRLRGGTSRASGAPVGAYNHSGAYRSSPARGQLRPGRASSPVFFVRRRARLHPVSHSLPLPLARACGTPGSGLPAAPCGCVEFVHTSVVTTESRTPRRSARGALQVCSNATGGTLHRRLRAQCLGVARLEPVPCARKRPPRPRPPHPAPRHATLIRRPLQRDGMDRNIVLERNFVKRRPVPSFGSLLFVMPREGGASSRLDRPPSRQ